MEAILRPGVDGDVAGLLCATLLVREELEGSIEPAAGSFGLECRNVSAAEFVEAIKTPV